MDESCLALNIVNRSLVDLFSPLDYNQGAPLGFLFLVKFVTYIFGTSEFSLRLIPLIFGIGSLIIFYVLAQRTLSPKAVPIAVGLFALSYPLIYYSSEVKQYATDVFATIILLLIALRIRVRRLDYINIVISSLTGAILIWLSHPAIFILVAIALGVCLEDIFNKSWNHLFICLAVFSIWAISFGYCYSISLSKLARNDCLISYWSNYYFGLPLFSEHNIKIFLSNLFYVFDDQSRIKLGKLKSLFSIPFIIGAGSIWVKDKNKLFILIFPIILLIITSFLHKYPFAFRLILFISPVIILVTAQGVGDICGYLKKRHAIWGILFISLFFLFFAARDASYIFSPTSRQDMRSVLNFMKAHYQQGENIYLYNFSRYAYNYYKHNYDFPQNKVTIGTVLCDEKFKINSLNFSKDLQIMRSHRKEWVVFSNIMDIEKIDILKKIEKYGKIINQYEAEGSSTYLFQFNKP